MPEQMQLQRSPSAAESSAIKRASRRVERDQARQPQRRVLGGGVGRRLALADKTADRGDIDARSCARFAPRCGTAYLSEIKIALALTPIR